MKLRNILFFCLIFISILVGCSRNDDEIIPANTNPHNLQNLGLTAENNVYPNYPDTWQAGLMDNWWYDKKNGDTLIVYRRGVVYDDGGDWIYYKFLIKPKEWIVPLNTTRIMNDVYADPPMINFVMYNVPITNFKLQEYTENKVLACEVETPNGEFYGIPLIDRMWVKLDD